MSVFRSRFFWKIYLTFSLLFLCTTLGVSWVVVNRVQATVRNNVIESLSDKVALLVPDAERAFRGEIQNPKSLITDLGRTSNTRITLVANGGEVLADSLDGANFDNHWQRPEIQDALARPLGYSERFSAALHRQMLYVAKAIRSGEQVLGVLRVSLPIDKVEGELGSVRLTIALIATAGIIVAMAIGWLLAQKVTVPISEMMSVAEAMRDGHYEKKVKTLTDDELGRLGDTLNRLGSELTKQITELNRLETVRRDFVANVSHEIKTPLTSIKGYVETLMSGAVNDPQHNIRFLEKIDRNAARLTALVQDILSLAKIEAQEQIFKPVPTDWRPIVNSVIARYEDSIQEKNLKIQVTEPPTPLVVLGDKEAMIQVLDNLLTNAIKYTPAGGRINVTLSNKSRWGKLEVEDTGIGIPTQHLDRIFERFYRIDKARSRDLGGTGLGLSIVKHLVSGMNGEIGVESNVGVGSRFTVQLQLAS